jgi:hypothetical protein
MPFQDLLAMCVNFAMEHRFHARTLEAKIKSTYTSEE